MSESQCKLGHTACGNWFGEVVAVGEGRAGPTADVLTGRSAAVEKNTPGERF